MPIRNIDKKKSNNEETKTEWQTTFCDLVHPPSLQKKEKEKHQRKQKQNDKQVAVLCPASIAAKKGQKKETKSILANFLL